MTTELNGIQAAVRSAVPVSAATLQAPREGVEQIQQTRPVQEARPVSPPEGGAASVLVARRVSPLGDSLGQVADTARYAKEALGRIETYVEQLKDQLTSVVKQYPPYPIDSQERVEYLNGFSSLRKQIDALTLPPENPALGQLIADPQRLPEAGDIVVGLPTGEEVVVRAQPAYSGVGGLDIPELAPQASDTAVTDALGRVAEALYDLISKRSNLEGDLQRLGSGFGEPAAQALGTTVRQQFSQADGLGISLRGDTVLAAVSST